MAGLIMHLLDSICFLKTRELRNHGNKHSKTAEIDKWERGKGEERGLPACFPGRKLTSAACTHPTL